MSWPESILFTVSSLGEIRSLKSPLDPFPCRPAPSSLATVCSPLQKKRPQQDLRASSETKDLGPHAASPTSSVSSNGYTTPPSPLSSNEHATPPSPVSSSGYATPPAPARRLEKALELRQENRSSESHLSFFERQEAAVKRTAIEIARSRHIQIGLQRRYWDPVLVARNQAQGPATTPPLPAKLRSNTSKAVALTDTNIPGDPIRLCTPDFPIGPRGLKVGTCLFLNMPYGASDACGLQIQMKDGSAADKPAFLLEMAAAVVDAATGRRRWRLCTLLDVTDVVTGMARVRVAEDLSSLVRTSWDRAGRTGEVEHQQQDGQAAEERAFDWTAFADSEIWGSPRAQGSGDGDGGGGGSRPPSFTRTYYRLSGSTLTPSLISASSSTTSSARTTLIGSHPSPLPTPFEADEHGEVDGHVTTAQPPASPPPLFPTTTDGSSSSIPADALAFLDLAASLRREHARFFVLTPLRRYGSGSSAAAPARVPVLLNHAVAYVSATLLPLEDEHGNSSSSNDDNEIRGSESGGQEEEDGGGGGRRKLHPTLDRVLLRSGTRALARLARGLGRGRRFLWEAGCGGGGDCGGDGGGGGAGAEGRVVVECVPVDDGRSGGRGGRRGGGAAAAAGKGETWWVCFVKESGSGSESESSG